MTHSQFLKVNISLARQSQRHNFSSFSHKTHSYVLFYDFMSLCINPWSPLSLELVIVNELESVRGRDKIPSG